MIFNRPTNVTLTQMAQWVDANVNNEQRDNDLFVEYVYHLAYNKAQKLALFIDYDVYEDFALFCVSKFLVRCSNKSEAPVKSVVNYLRTVIEHWEAEYVREYCYGSPEATIADFNVCDFSDYLVDITSEYDQNNYNFFCVNVSDVIRKHLRQIPYKKNSAEWCNIYTSCLLTLRDRIHTGATLCNNSANTDIEYIYRVIRQLKTKPPILYHIDEDKGTYVSVLVNEIIHALAAELTHAVHAKVSPSDCLKNLIKAANNEEDND